MQDAVRRAHQSVIDAETRASRAAIIDTFRQRLRTDPGTLTAEDFLALADRALLHAAIVLTAYRHARADACDLQIHDSRTGVLHLTQHLGFSPAFLNYFAAVDTDVPSACGQALTTGERVLVDDIATSPVFAGHQTRAVMLASGSRAVQTYPLFDEHGGLLGMLSMHYHRPGRHDDHEPLARAAATALSRFGAAHEPPPHPRR